MRPLRVDKAVSKMKTGARKRMKTYPKFVYRIRLFLRLEMGAAKAVEELKTLCVWFGTMLRASELTVQIEEWSTSSTYNPNIQWCLFLSCFV